MTIHLCKNCGGIVNEDYIYCPWCGKLIGGDDKNGVIVAVPAGVTEIKIEVCPEKTWKDKVSSDGEKSVKAPEETYITVLKYVAEMRVAPVSMIQRQFPIGYVKACKIMDWMEDNGFVAPYSAGEMRSVLITPDEVIELFGKSE